MKNLRNVAHKYGARIVTAAALTAPALSFAADPTGNAVLDSVDFTTVAAWVGGIGITIIGIRMAFKGIDLGKRAVNKV